MPRFRKRPVEVEAVQWTGDNEAELLAFTGGEFEKDPTPGDPDDGGVYNRDEDGHGDTWAGVSPGDWLAKGPDGLFFSIAPDVLAETYEPVIEPVTVAMGPTVVKGECSNCGKSYSEAPCASWPRLQRDRSEGDD